MGTFAVFLTDDSNSEITFGGYKPDQVASDIVWSKVVRESYWQVGVDDITFNNKETGLCNGGCQVAVDTGTSMLAGPSDLVEKLTNKLNAKDDCSNFDQLPTIGFKVNNKVLNLSPEDYMDKSAGDCSFSVMSLDVPPPKGPLFIFGDPFLRRFVTIYDRNGPRVGFAVAKHGNMDAAQASKIISDVVGEKQASNPASSGADPKASEKVLTLSLEAGMMTRDTGGSDHSDTGSKETAKSDGSDSDVDGAELLAKKRKDAESQDINADFASSVDNWLKGSSSPAAKTDTQASNMRQVFQDALVQKTPGLGLRGHQQSPKVQESKLITVRLHKSGAVSGLV
jgi:hypothetical protein